MVEADASPTSTHMDEKWKRLMDDLVWGSGGALGCHLKGDRSSWVKQAGGGVGRQEETETDTGGGIKTARGAEAGSGRSAAPPVLPVVQRGSGQCPVTASG